MLIPNAAVPLIPHTVVVLVVDELPFATMVMMGMDDEFATYKHHERPSPDVRRQDWVRLMYHSLTQQLLRQDPIWYALVVATQPDHQWRLISYPYITKNTRQGEKTGFLHLDIDVGAYLESGVGGPLSRPVWQSRTTMRRAAQSLSQASTSTSNHGSHGCRREGRSAVVAQPTVRPRTSARIERPGGSQCVFVAHWLTSRLQ